MLLFLILCKRAFKGNVSVKTNASESWTVQYPAQLECFQTKEELRPIEDLRLDRRTIIMHGRNMP